MTALLDVVRDRVSEPWMLDGACVGQNPEIFHPGQGGDQSQALAFCAVCPVVDECLAFALAHHEVGVWGGTSERGRARIRKAARERP